MAKDILNNFQLIKRILRNCWFGKTQTGTQTHTPTHKYICWWYDMRWCYCCIISFCPIRIWHLRWGFASSPTFFVLHPLVAVVIRHWGGDFHGSAYVPLVSPYPQLFSIFSYSNTLSVCRLFDLLFPSLFQFQFQLLCAVEQVPQCKHRIENIRKFIGFQLR